MAPRKRARGSTQTAATPTPAHDDDAMDVDTPRTGGSTSKPKDDMENSNDLWTDDQIASLFKGVIRWKPAGMHKHFRMIAISEHLRNHGFDPDACKHTRIPHIWKKLRTYYNLEVIDERENFDEDEIEERYNEFCLPKEHFWEAMMQRAIADPSEAPTSPPELELSPPSSPQPKKRKRGDTVSKARGVSVEDTEEGTDAPSPVPKSVRGSRRKRAASQAKTEKTEKAEKVDKVDKAETTEEEEGNEGEESGEGEEEEEVAEENGTPARTTRGTQRGRTKSRTTKGRSRRR